MAKRKVKNKFNFLKFIIFVIILSIIIVVSYYLINTKTKNIVILNNNYYNDEEIIETANLENYPKFLLLSKSKIKKKLLKLDLIEDVKITKKWGFILNIEVKEKKILYFVRSSQKYMLSTNELLELDNVNGIPTLINYVPEDIEKSFVNGLKKIDSNVISLISEIEYSVTNYDDKRFLLYMNDGNLVYITISKIDVLNKYVEILQKLNNKKGILHLDSGNYLEIKK